MRDIDHIKGERWREIPNHSGYKVSDHGRIYSRYMKKMMKCCLRASGYLFVQLTIDKEVAARIGKKAQPVSVHGLVMRIFVGPCPPFENIDHIDGNKKNNKLSNLEYVTHRENKRRHSARTRPGMLHISRNTRHTGWTVRISTGSRSYYIGKYATIEEAQGPRDMAVEAIDYHIGRLEHDLTEIRNGK